MNVVCPPRGHQHPRLGSEPRGWASWGPCPALALPSTDHGTSLGVASVSPSVKGRVLRGVTASARHRVKQGAGGAWAAGLTFPRPLALCPLLGLPGTDAALLLTLPSRQPRPAGLLQKRAESWQGLRLFWERGGVSGAPLGTRCPSCRAPALSAGLMALCGALLCPCARHYSKNKGRAGWHRPEVRSNNSSAPSRSRRSAPVAPAVRKEMDGERSGDTSQVLVWAVTRPE